MSFKTLLKRGNLAANRPVMAPFLQSFTIRTVAKTIKEKNKNIGMYNEKTMSVPAPIFSWEYNMNELEFE